MARKLKETKKEVQDKLVNYPNHIQELITERKHLTLVKTTLEANIENTRQRIAEIDKKIDVYEKSREVNND